MRLPFSSASFKPDLEIILPGHPKHFLHQCWSEFRTFSRSHQIQIAVLAILGIITISLTFTFTLLISNNIVSSIAQQGNTIINNPDQDANNSPENSDSPQNPPGQPIPTFIDLQTVVNNWSSKVRAKVGLMIYDLDNNKIAAELNANQIFSTASIYKLFFAYVGYQDIDSGHIDPDQSFAITNDYRADTYTFSECLDLMIRESYNGCADLVRSNQHLYRRVENLISELELSNTTDGGLFSTPADLATFLRFLYNEHDLSAQSWANFQDSMLNQPPTTINEDTVYDWRQGLPTGFSDDVKVYDKVGWAWNGTYWTVYNDAAIVEFPDLNRHYIIVLLTADLHEDPPLSLQQLGAELETAIRTRE